ncbi:MAG: sodium-dependent bicarbonate transport family permease [Bacteroidota bacterium]
MDLLSLIQQNLLSPHLLFFALGILAGLAKSDLAVPEQVGKFFFIYLMLAIGFKGGVAIAETPVDARLIGVTVGGVLAGFLQPFLSYFLLRQTSRLDKLTAAAVAAHYGSISMVTFLTAANFLEGKGVAFAGYMTAVIALMEAPAIVSGLFIAHRVEPQLTKHTTAAGSHGFKNIARNGALVLLVGAFVIGWITGPIGLKKIEGFIVTPFQGILVFFLLDMGLTVAKHIVDLKSFSIGLLLFGIYMPVLNAVAGIGFSRLIGLDPGTGFLFSILMAGASYIVVTAAMRVTLPQAKVAIYLPMSLAITFPFNITLGIPLYFSLAERLLA